jgi:hypothetical protein
MVAAVVVAAVGLVESYLRTVVLPDAEASAFSVDRLYLRQKQRLVAVLF